MIETILMVMLALSFVGGDDDNDDDDDLIDKNNSTISGCDYYGGANLRMGCPQEFCPENAFGENSSIRDLLSRDPRCVM